MRLAKCAASFANTSGGVLVVGFNETVTPWEICGLANFDEDIGVRSVEQLLRQNVEPPIPGLKYRVLRRDGGSPVLLIGVPRSLSGPHRAGSEFVRRNSRGSESMTVSELRDAFLEADRWVDAAETYHAERTVVALGQEPLEVTVRRHAPPVRDVPERLRQHGALLLHLLPLGRKDPWSAPALMTPPWIAPTSLNFPEWVDRDNLDGRLWIEGHYDQRRQWYVDLKGGGGEYGTSLEESHWIALNPTRRIVGYSGSDIELTIASAVSCLLERARHRATSPPFALVLSLFVQLYAKLMRERGYRTTFEGPLEDPHPIRHRGFDRTLVTLPAFTLLDPPVDIGRWLRPVFDAMWQAAGEPRSPNYDAAGAWSLSAEFAAENEPRRAEFARHTLAQG